MGNELSQHIEQSQKTGVLQLRSFKLTQVNYKNQISFISYESC